MKILLEKHEAEKYFHSALCNGLGYFQSYEIEVKYNEDEYDIARKTAKDEYGNKPCYEDVLMEMLKLGYSIQAEDSNSGETHTLTLNDLHFQMNNVEPRWILEMVNERDDADTADAILQVCFIGEHIYG